MGCDIHLFTEKQKTVNSELGWHNCDDWQLNEYFGDEHEAEYNIKPVYKDRDYHLFAVLAGVRDYSGEDQAICEPKGLPGDVTAATKAESDRWNGDGHSHSFFTLAELRKHLKDNRAFKTRGMISPAQAEALDSRGELPNSWCQRTSDDTYVWREWEIPSPLERLIEKLEERFKAEFWIWGDEWDADLEKKFRVVFWFDN